MYCHLSSVVLNPESSDFSLIAKQQWEMGELKMTRKDIWPSSMLLTSSYNWKNQCLVEEEQRRLIRSFQVSSKWRTKNMTLRHSLFYTSKRANAKRLLVQLCCFPNFSRLKERH